MLATASGTRISTNEPMKREEDLDALDRLSHELLKRLSKDGVGPPVTAASHLVGRLVQAGSALENLLRAVVVYVAARELRDVEELLAPAGGKKPSFRKAMAGSLAYGLRNYFSQRPSKSIPVRVGSLIDDLLSPDSSILRFIAVRNDVAKEDGDPAQGRAAATDLKATILDFRRRAGWV
jgi:hypothetical protein